MAVTSAPIDPKSRSNTTVFQAPACHWTPTPKSSVLIIPPTMKSTIPARAITVRRIKRVRSPRLCAPALEVRPWWRGCPGAEEGVAGAPGPGQDDLAPRSLLSGSLPGVVAATEHGIVPKQREGRAGCPAGVAVAVVVVPAGLGE